MARGLSTSRPRQGPHTGKSNNQRPKQPVSSEPAGPERIDQIHACLSVARKLCRRANHMLGGSIKNCGLPLVVMEAMTLVSSPEDPLRLDGDGAAQPGRRDSCGRRHEYFRTRSAAARHATDFSIAQAVEAERKDLARDRDLGDLAAAALCEFEAVAERAAAAAGVLSCSIKAQRRVAIPADDRNPSAPVARRPAPAPPDRRRPLTANHRAAHPTNANRWIEA